MNTHPPTDAAPPRFSENDFERLAAAIDATAPAQRALFLTKLVILMAAAMPQGALAGQIARAHKNLESIAGDTP